MLNEVGLGYTLSDLGLDHDLVSAPQSFGLVSVRINSGIGHDLVWI